jgi:large subunit ribosomal protein L29
MAKSTRASEFRDMSSENLLMALRDTTQHLFKLRFQSATEKLDTPSEMKRARREIARIKTIQREREIEAAKKITE